jgi:hypothetical protein
MAEPAGGDRMLPGRFRERARRRVEEDPDLALRFAPVLRGFEQYGLAARVEEYRYQFEEALRDLLACVRCEGRCRTGLYIPGGLPLYLALDRAAIRASRERLPYFKAYRCPGVEERKRRIRKLLVAGE